MPFQKPPTKAELRKQLQRQVDAYLNRGGKVQSVARGISGRESSLPLARVLFDGPKENRTYVNDIVASIESRKKKSVVKPTKAAKKPKLKTIYDDFGEPLRKIWVED
jgi:hypothetical protein